MHVLRNNVARSHNNCYRVNLEVLQFMSVYL